MSGMIKILLQLFLLAASPLKEEIATYEKELKRDQSRGETHYKLALAYYQDQEVDRAFHHFLAALKTTPLCRLVPKMSPEEKKVYEEALADYASGGGSDPVRVARHMIEKYGERADGHREWIHLNFLMATAHANLGVYDSFFERFYAAYPYLGETFLAYKTRGILYLRLSQHSHSSEERLAYQKEAFHYLTLALDRNLKDAGLYKVLIFLAKDEKNEALVLTYLQKMVEHEAHIARGDIYTYVREAVALGEVSLAQQIVDLARAHYDFSRALSAAQEYLNQCRG